MARTKGLNKSAFVREIFTKNPDTPTPDVIKALKKKRIFVTSSMVATTRCQMRDKESGSSVSKGSEPTFYELQVAKKLSKLCGGSRRAALVLKELDLLTR
jgi:hypothetical protein